MKGQAVSIDFIAAMAIFIFMVAVGFFIVQDAFVPRGGFEQQVQAAADSALTNFEDETEWTVYSTPIAVRSNRSLRNEPVRVDFPFPGIVENTTLVTKDGRELRSQHNRSTNETLVVTDLREGGTRLDVVYTRTGTFNDREYTSSLETGGDSVWNDDINVTFTASGLSKLEFDGTGLLEDEADLAGGATPAFDEQLLQANVTYSSGRKHVRLFEDSGQIRTTEFFTGEREWQLNLTSSFDTLYSAEEGDTIDISGSGIHYTATTDWADFTDQGNGLSIVGDDIFVNVSRESAGAKVKVEVNVSASGGRKDLLLYPHKGNHTNATAQKKDFYHPYSTTVGVPQPLDGVSEQEAGDLESRGYDEVRTTLGLSGLEYNISIPGVFSAGRDVQTDRTVSVVDIPVPVVKRFGNASARDMVIRIWN